MARIRTIKPDFWTSEQVVECSVDARLLFIGIWNFADDAGIHPASVKRLKMEVFPGDDYLSENIRRMVDELIDNGLIIEYEVENKRYWQVTGWVHQKIDKATYKYPNSDGVIETTIRRTVAERSPPEGKGREGKGSNTSQKKFSDEDLKIAQQMFSRIKDLNSGAKEPNFESWANDIRLMRDQDQRTHSDIQQLFEWANQHVFWKANILSPSKLRKQWDTLTIQKNNGPNAEASQDDYSVGAV